MSGRLIRSSNSVGSDRPRSSSGFNPHSSGADRLNVRITSASLVTISASGAVSRIEPRRASPAASARSWRSARLITCATSMAIASRFDIAIA